MSVVRMPSRAEVRAASTRFVAYEAPVAQMVTGDPVVGAGWFERPTELARFEQPKTWQVHVSPGAIRIGWRQSPKPAIELERREAVKSLRARLRASQEPCWDECYSERCGGCRRQEARRMGKIGAWSAKSRRAMKYRLGTLDYAPLFTNVLGVETMPAMVTLTYPGDWQSVAPSNRKVVSHVEALRKRWDREFADLGFPLIGVWKREFQRRGAPHYHVLCVPPRVEGFREWLSEAWAEIVGAAWCGRDCWRARDGRPAIGLACCERGRHVVAGTGIDYREGAKATDPARLSVYFSKHGGFSAKEYQNTGPALWVGRGGVGRFWGVWGLEVATEVVTVDPAVALAVGRALRRHQYANRYVMTVPVAQCGRAWQADPITGELHSHVPRCYGEKEVVVRYFKGSAGYVVVNDGIAMANMLARVGDAVLDDLDPPDPVETRHGARWWANTGRRRAQLP